jgi:hypothetical protein
MDPGTSPREAQDDGVVPSGPDAGRTSGGYSPAFICLE